ncbi:hypothetical protein [Hugenholtzia roseola]|uniref:hypothetical protein n=1 Tax=Hugenholtzia roseola TaxID=1002 RepID=UPI00040BAF15|nr:hypothetical protein [Hugenholtzia roseola]
MLPFFFVKLYSDSIPIFRRLLCPQTPLPNGTGVGTKVGGKPQVQGLILAFLASKLRLLRTIWGLR